MAGKPYLRRGLAWAAGVACAAGAALVTGAGGAWSATHYPPGAICYDCHAVSKSKMVVGTHLLKKSDRTVALGISASNPRAPCLFCHDRNATPSLVNRDRMKGVWDHFDATSASKHRAAIQSGFEDHSSIFDCRDCHTGIAEGVESDGSGNATVHGIDASGGTRLNVPGTLIGWRAVDYSMSSHTCRNAACHGGDGTPNFGYTARPAHGMGKATINGGAAPTSCTQCHGTHNSYQNTSLITLRTDGTTSNDPGDPLATRVTPEKCGVCHVQDDAGVYAAKGHGQSTISSGTVGCIACHTGAVPHAFSGSAPGTNPLRFAFAENTSVQSSIRRRPPYNQVYSVCLTCHSQFAGKAHSGRDGEYAGCNDCHEPHGAGVGGNGAMVRTRIPKVDAAGYPVYGASGSSGTWETITYTGPLDFYRGDQAGLCDNAECHQGQTSAGGAALYPLATFMSGGLHSDGNQAPGSNCQDCHKHTDSAGSWGALDSCTTCHGQPPPPADPGYSRFSEAVTGHRKHAGHGTGQYGYHCSRCHNAYPGSHLDGDYQSVAFGSQNPSGTYNAGTATCANLYCHSDGQSAASVGSAPAWDAGALTCRNCHGGVEGPTRIATVSHPQHLASGATCVHCHSDTVTSVGTDTTTYISGLSSHVNGVKNLKSGGTYFGQTVTFAVGGAATCTNISCHNNGNANWGAALACSDCHFRTAAQGGDIDNFVYGDGILAAVNSDEWGGPNTGSGHGRSGTSYPSGNSAANFSGPASDLRGCAYCHDADVGHGVETNPFRLANRGTVSGTGNEHGGWNDACLVCHKTGQSGYDPDGVGGVYSSRNGTRNVDENHYGTKHAAGRNGGAFCWDCHDPHGDTQHYMIHSGDGSAPGRGVTDRSDGAYGIPVTSRQVTGLDVVSGGYTSSDLVNTVNTGLCQTCHASSEGAAYYNRSTFTPLASHNGADGTRCTACHTHDNDFGAACNSCHGGATAGQSPANTQNWPDGITADAYPDRAGAHAVHVAAIGTGNASCTTCHPGNPPGGHPDDTASGANQAEVSRMDTTGDGSPNFWAASYFKTLQGANDTDATYRTTNRRCYAADCHGGSVTPPWYPDTAAPVFAGGVSGISASNPATGGTLNVSWNTATDAYPSDPVRYDLYLSTTNSSAAVFGSAPVYTNLLGTSATVTGLVNGTTYYFGARAKDSASPPNVTTNTDISAGRAPSGGAAGPTNPTYRGRFDATTSVGADGSTHNSAQTVTSSAFVRGLLYTNTASTSREMRIQSVGTTHVTLARFYLKPNTGVMESYTNDTWIGPNLTDGSFAVRSSDTSDRLQVRLLSYDPDGLLLNGAVIATTPEINSPGGTATALSFPLTFDRHLLPRGNLLVLEIQGRAGGSSSEFRLYAGNDGSATARVHFTVPVEPADVTAPAWSGGVSGLAVSDAGTGGALNLSWNSASDAQTPPVVYDLFRSAVSATDVWNNLHRAGLGVTSLQDTGLTDGVRYYYGVRARDSASPPNATTNTETASAVPTSPSTGCTLCHGTPPATGAHLKHAAADNDYTDCDRCHGNETYSVSPARGGGYTASGPAGLHNNGVVEVYMRANGETNASWNGATCSSVDCHGNVTTPNWVGDSVACGTCHGKTQVTEDRSAFLDTGTAVQGAPPLDRSGSSSGTKVGRHLEHVNVSWSATGNSCDLCHLGAGSGSGVHGDMNAQINFHSYVGSTATWNVGTNTCSNLGGNCHVNSTWDTVATISACTDCHRGTGTGALAVGSTSSHVKTTRTGSFAGCQACHAGHADVSTPDVPQNAANRVEIRTRYGSATPVPTMNHRYATHGYKVRLGGTATSGNTEAEMCWNCHDVQNPRVSEWGINQRANTGNLIYDYGSLYTTLTGPVLTSNWTTGFWRSGKGQSSGGASNPFWYKRGAIQSTHSVNFEAGTSQVTAGNSLGYNRTETKDSVANIRCSYCHDVHGTHDGVAGDPGGLPYLRGTWKGNPYPEDGAPQWGMANWTVDPNTTLTFGRVPRGSAASNNSGLSGVPQAGGWWIDQNSGNPNAGETLEATAGLCIQCHGSDVDNMDHRTGENLWISGGNGHRNAVIGGSGTTASAHNIYTRALRGKATAEVGRRQSPDADMGLATDYDRGFKHRSNDSGGYRYYPRIATTSHIGTGTTEPYSFRYFPWNIDYNSSRTRQGAAIAPGTMKIQVADQDTEYTSAGIMTEAASYPAQSKYHTFNCGKCHNPHASRLPKLLITNCLDTNHNTWDNNYQALGNLGAPWSGTRISQWSPAINCHRLDDRATLSSGASVERGPGWNKVSPWLEYTNPDATPSSNPNP